MFGALGSTSGNNFYMGTQNGLINSNGFFIHTFKLTICSPEFFPHVLRPRVTWLCSHINVMTFSQNCNIASLLAFVWLYYACSYTSLIPRHHSQLCSATHWKACFSHCLPGEWGLQAMNMYDFGTIFFFILLSVSVPCYTLSRKKKRNWIICGSTWAMIFLWARRTIVNTSELKLWHFEIFPCCIRKPCICNVFRSHVMWWAWPGSTMGWRTYVYF